MRRSRTTPIGRESRSSDSDQRLQDRQCFRCRVVAPDSSRGTNAYAKMFSAERPAPLVFKHRHLARVQQFALEKKENGKKGPKKCLIFAQSMLGVSTVTMCICEQITTWHPFATAGNATPTGPQSRHRASSNRCNRRESIHSSQRPSRGRRLLVVPEQVPQAAPKSKPMSVWIACEREDALENTYLSHLPAL
jgi:hypothetical protein